MNCISATETGFCTKWCTSNEQTPRPPSSAHHEPFRPSHRCSSFTIPLTIRCRIIWSNFSTQLRRTQGLNTEYLTVSVLFFSCSADHERDWPPCKVVFFRVGNQCAECKKLQQQQLWRTPSDRSIRSRSHQRRLHTTQSTKRHQTFSKVMYVNGEHSRTRWVRYLVSWANLLFRHGCQRMLCL